jgi:hypothetical protein
MSLPKTGSNIGSYFNALLNKYLNGFVIYNLFPFYIGGIWIASLIIKTVNLGQSGKVSAILELQKAQGGFKCLS